LRVQYIHDEQVHNFVAPREVVPVIMQIVRPTSVLDVGCGTGTWLKVFEENGVSDYLGVDGSHLDRTMLRIPQEHFVAHDLQTPLRLSRKFDLVVSLEVAEHLEERYSDVFVDSLVSHGEIILFSAAIPYQGGQNHLNEQWPDYWQKKFESHGFFFKDCIRPVIWDNQNVNWWYKQNIFLITKEKPKDDFAGIRSVVHPDLYTQVITNNVEDRKSLREGRQGLKISIMILINTLAYKFRELFRFK